MSDAEAFARGERGRGAARRGIVDDSSLLQTRTVTMNGDERTPMPARRRRRVRKTTSDGSVDDSV